MPIADDIKRFYPDDWDAIRKEVLERATVRPGDLPLFHDGRIVQFLHEPTPCCEWCSKPNGRAVYSFANGWESLIVPKGGDDPVGWLSVTDEGDLDDLKMFDDLDDDTHALIWLGLREERKTNVVLTIAHLDQDPRGDDPERLRALCQRCHLAYDARPEQRARRQRLYLELRGQQTLFTATDEARP